jgi:hypothetical protein
MKAMQLNTMLHNGAQVVAFFEGPGNEGIVLARRDHELHPYVTWAYNPGDSESTTWGHYYESYKEAWADFVARVDRTK